MTALFLIKYISISIYCIQYTVRIVKQHSNSSAELTKHGIPLKLNKSCSSETCSNWI